MNRNWLAVAGAVVLLGASACGGDDGGGGGGGGTGGGGKNGGGEACNVFTKAELEQAIGNALLDGESLSSTVCDWRAEDPTTGASVSLQFFRGAAESYPLTVEKLAEIFPSATIDEDVSGIGDQAYVMETTMGTGEDAIVSIQVGATQGDDLVVVTVGGFEKEGVDLVEVTKNLTIEALRHL